MLVGQAWSGYIPCTFPLLSLSKALSPSHETQNVTRCHPVPVSQRRPLRVMIKEQRYLLGCETKSHQGPWGERTVSLWLFEQEQLTGDLSAGSVVD